ncbi:MULTISPECIES: right-handed parallel beta-helix repeat-containing protein [unclassified Ruegeria]|uniref:right-handed parallel beta-helix repeat-containing protein n=1 Tax=unclassified Ruegeria TaxID=2625375 RepID=UPI001AE46AB4|nr:MULTISPECIES: right-handed parallel beta-helix repeat-containing protein [unclassified Ruegeria]
MPVAFLIDERDTGGPAMRDRHSSFGMLVGACILLLSFSAPSYAAGACTDTKATTNVSGTEKGQTLRNASELAGAVKNAKGGEIFILEGGNYGALKISKAFRKPVTIRSTNPSSPACFTELHLKQSSNVTFESIRFDYTYQNGQSEFTKPFVIENSSNVTISGSVFDGDVARGTGTAADGLGTGKGLIVRGSANVIIAHTRFYSWWNALTVNTSSNVEIVGNNIHNIRSDGIKLGSSDTVLIADNHIHNFQGDQQNLSDHRDMIQIQRSSKIGVKNLTIRDNVFDMGSGIFTQTIWAGRDKANPKDPTNWHTNLLIENNVIYNAHSHGISIHLANGLSIRRNSVIRVRRRNSENISIPKIRVSKNSQNVVIEQNAVAAINGFHGQRNWFVQNNAIIQDTSSTSQGFYDREFIYYATGPANGHNEYGVRPGSQIDRLNAGSTLVKNYPTRK